MDYAVIHRKFGSEWRGLANGIIIQYGHWRTSPGRLAFRLNSKPGTTHLSPPGFGTLWNNLRSGNCSQS